VLHAIGQLATLSTPKRVLVIGSARTPTSMEQTSSLLDRLVAAFERVGWVDRIALEPLDARDIEELLERMRVAPRDGLAGRLYDLTTGNPLLLAELLNSATPEEIVDQWSSPPRIRDIARKRIAELGRATAEALQFASLFEDDFTVELLADAAGTTVAATAKLVDRASDAHVLQQNTLHSYRFTHQLFRQAILADLSAAQREKGHRQIANALERLDPMPSPALLTAHWSGASGPDVAAKVVTYARAAGLAAMQIFEPGTAVKWFDIALANLAEPAERGSLLVELAEAQQFAGDPNGTATLQEAVGLALDSNDDALTLQIVRVTTPGWSTLPGVDGPSTQQLLGRALTIADDDSTRSRILARQATELNLYQPDAAENLADEAVALARRSRDRTALLEALLQRASVSLRLQTLAARRAALHEVLDLSSRATDVVTRYFALSAK